MFGNKGFSFTKNTSRKQTSDFLKFHLTKYPVNIHDVECQYHPLLKDEETFQHHASCSINIQDRFIVQVWFSGEFEGYFNHIKISHLDIQKNIWSVPVTCQYINYCSLQNPVLYFDPITLILYLFISAIPSKKGQHNSQIIYQTIYLKSQLQRNQLKLATSNWSAPKPLSTTKGLLTKHQPVKVDHNIVVLPIYQCFTNNQYDKSLLIFCYLNELHITGLMKLIPESTPKVQPCLVPVSDGYWQLFFRTRKKNQTKISYLPCTQKVSQFELPYRDTNLISNNSAFDIITYKNVLLLVGNEGIKFRDRHILTLSYSRDKGNSFITLFYLEPNLTLKMDMNSLVMNHDQLHDAEFSYPSIYSIPGYLGISYSYNRETIKNLKIPLEMIDKMIK